MSESELVAGERLQEEVLEVGVKVLVLDCVDYLACETVYQQLAGRLQVDAAASHVEDGVLVDVPGGRSVAALDVVGVYEEGRLGVHLGFRRQQQVLVGLVGVDLSGENLVRADLTGADLTGADLTGSFFKHL